MAVIRCILLTLLMALVVNGATEPYRRKYRELIALRFSEKCRIKLYTCTVSNSAALAQDYALQFCAQSNTIEECSRAPDGCTGFEYSMFRDASCKPIPDNQERQFAYFFASLDFIYAIIGTDCQTNLRRCFNVEKEDWSDFSFTSQADLCSKFVKNYECFNEETKCPEWAFELYYSVVCDYYFTYTYTRNRLGEITEDFTETCQNKIDGCMGEIPGNENTGLNEIFWSPKDYCEVIEAKESCFLEDNACTSANFDTAKDFACGPVNDEEVKRLKMKSDFVFINDIVSENCRNKVKSCYDVAEDDDRWTSFDFSNYNYDTKCALLKSKMECMREKCSTEETDLFDLHVCDDYYERAGFRNLVAHHINSIDKDCKPELCAASIQTNSRQDSEMTYYWLAYEVSDHCDLYSKTDDCLETKAGCSVSVKSELKKLACGSSAANTINIFVLLATLFVIHLLKNNF